MRLPLLLTLLFLSTPADTVPVLGSLPVSLLQGGTYAIRATFASGSVECEPSTRAEQNATATRTETFSPNEDCSPLLADNFLLSNNYYCDVSRRANLSVQPLTAGTVPAFDLVFTVDAMGIWWYSLCYWEVDRYTAVAPALVVATSSGTSWGYAPSPRALQWLVPLFVVLASVALCSAVAAISVLVRTVHRYRKTTPITDTYEPTADKVTAKEPALPQPPETPPILQDVKAEVSQVAVQVQQLTLTVDSIGNHLRALTPPVGVENKVDALFTQLRNYEAAHSEAQSTLAKVLQGVQALSEQAAAPSSLAVAVLPSPSLSLPAPLPVAEESDPPVVPEREPVASPKKITSELLHPLEKQLEEIRRVLAVPPLAGAS